MSSEIPTPATPAVADAVTPPRPFGAAIAMLLLVGLLAGSITLVRGSIAVPEPGAAPGGMPGMAMTGDAAPVAPETLRRDVAQLYRHAAEHPDVYRDVPCYCGCDRFADHRHLYDCFVRPDGAGFEAHGAGCAICQAEAVEVRRLLRSGRSPTQVRDAVIEQFGPASNPARA